MPQRRVLGSAPKPKGGAKFSACGTYRYKLWRDIGKGPPLLMIMLNPSTADATVDDPTIRRCTALALRLGCGKLVVVNLFGYRSPHPKELPAEDDAAQGPLNYSYIGANVRQCIKAGGTVVCAWGAHKRAEQVAHHFMQEWANVVPLYCLGTNKNGSPKHPLYVPDYKGLEEY